MAIFGAPLSDGKDSANAVKAGLEILDKVAELNRNGIIEPTRVGIGLHTGPAVTGNVGSEERKEYTIIGDTVNLASRVEQMNKEFGSEFLITDAVLDAVPDKPSAERLAPVTVKGRVEPVILYRLR